MDFRNDIITIQYSLDGFSFLTFDEKDNKVTSLQHQDISEANNTLHNTISAIQKNYGLNVNDFCKVNILCDNEENTLIPASIFRNDTKSACLRYLGLENDSYIIVDYLEHLQANNIFAISTDDYEEIKNFPDNFKIIHSSSILIESIIKDYFNRQAEDRVFINVKNKRFELTVMKGVILSFHNTFKFNTKEDFLYFLLFTLEQLHIDNEAASVYFLGFIEEQSQIIELCSRYLREIRFVKRDNNLKYSKELETIPFYYHYTLFKSLSCEL